MPDQSRIVSPGPDAHSVRTPDGEILQAPPDWMLLMPGDATLTRRVKTSGPTWTVQERRGRKVFSRGIWAPQTTVERVREELEAERSTPQYARKQASAARRREKLQTNYVEEFRDAVLKYLAFHPHHAELANRLAEAVANHATPVGSGTVARTQRIPIERRAEAAVIAWMRHQTTTYDDMAIPRAKGQRREVRRLLAEQSRRLLGPYREGETMAADNCPLRRALDY